MIKTSFSVVIETFKKLFRAICIIFWTKMYYCILLLMHGLSIFCWNVHKLILHFLIIISVVHSYAFKFSSKCIFSYFDLRLKNDIIIISVFPSLFSSAIYKLKPTFFIYLNDHNIKLKFLWIIMRCFNSSPQKK